jgi:hypothetical protein
MVIQACVNCLRNTTIVINKLKPEKPRIVKNRKKEKHDYFASYALMGRFRQHLVHGPVNFTPLNQGVPQNF